MKNSTDVDNNGASLTMPEYLYMTYNGAGAKLRLFAPSAILFSIMIVGYFGNALVILATLKNRSPNMRLISYFRNLHGSCNFFLAFGCFADIFHTSAHWIYFYTTAVSGENFIPYSTCLWFQTLPQVFLTVSIIMTLCVGVDRFFSVSMPVPYGATDKRLVIAGGVGAAFLCSSYFYVMSVLFALSEQGDMPVLCVIVNSFGGAVSLQWFYFCVAINLLDLIIYTTVWLFLRFKAGMSDESKKVFRSLFVIMLTVAFGWLANAFVQAVMVPLFVPVDFQYDVMCYWGIPVNLASAAGFLTLYIFSQEYRTTFRRLLGLKELKNKNAPVFTPSAISTKSA